VCANEGPAWTAIFGPLGLVAVFAAPEVGAGLATLSMRASVAARLGAGTTGALKALFDGWKNAPPGMELRYKLPFTALSAIFAERSAVSRDLAILYAAVKALISTRFG
jgi:hypothetical protein